MPIALPTMRGLVDYRVEQVLTALVGVVNSLESVPKRVQQVEGAQALQAIQVERVNYLEQQVGTTTSGITQLTGDVAAGPGQGSQGAVLAPTGVGAGVYGSAALIPQITVDAKGRLTAAVNVPIAVAADYVVASDGATPTPSPMDDGAGNFMYIPYTP